MRVRTKTGLFDKRRPGESRWPVFRHALLTPAVITRLERLPDHTFFAAGSQSQYQKMGTSVVDQPAVSFELRKSVLSKRGEKRVLYFTIWLGQYVTETVSGVTIHINVQYPHVFGFAPEELERMSFYIYRTLAATLYGVDIYDPEVADFITHGESIFAAIN